MREEGIFLPEGIALLPFPPIHQLESLDTQPPALHSHKASAGNPRVRTPIPGTSNSIVHNSLPHILD